MHRTEFAKKFSILAWAVVALGLPLAIAGCNTTEGFGKDVEATGDAIEDAASD